MIGLRFDKNRRYALPFVSCWLGGISAKCGFTLKSGLVGVKILRGFTLIELLISVAILGILSAGVLVAVNPVKRQNQAKDAQIRSDIGQIATAAQSYFSSGSGLGSYPLDLGMLVTNSDLKNLPGPPGSVAYEYIVTADGGGVCDGSLGSPCVYARISEPLADPVVAGNVWCWQSSTGQAQELTLALCTP